MKKMKKSILAIAVVVASFAVPFSTYANGTPDTKAVVTEKVKKQFTEQFGTSDADLYEVTDGYVIKLNSDTKSITAVFNKKGNWVYSVERFPSNALLKSVIDRVAEDPSNGFVTGIQKVTRPGSEAVYVIQTEGKDFLKSLRLTGDNLETISDYKKG